jgi:hypothetical protein
MSSLDVQLRVLERLPELGCQWQPPIDDIPGHYGPFLIERRIIEFVVGALGHENSDIRNSATRILTNDTPDSLVRDHADAIEKALATYPDVPNGTLLIGKLGSNRALRFLQNSKELREADSLDVQAALGKLGIQLSESALVEAYLKEEEPREKRKFAWYLGYMATPKSLLTLARDLRTPLAYEWNQRAKRSFRIHVIAALRMAYPSVPLLWKPFFRPTGDEYYARIEAWAQSALGVDWPHPRPPFLYEEEVPMRRPGPPR